MSVVDYQVKPYPYNAIGDFFEGCRILQNPRPIARNYYSKNSGVKMFCSFCPEKLNCPINGLWFPPTRINEQISDDVTTVF